MTRTPAVQASPHVYQLRWGVESATAHTHLAPHTGRHGAVSRARADELLTAMTAMPPGHPDRAAQRDRAIELLQELRLAITAAKSELTIVVLRFYENLSQSGIAERVGISQMYVSRLVARALRQLRHEIDPQSR